MLGIFIGLEIWARPPVAPRMIRPPGHWGRPLPENIPRAPRTVRPTPKPKQPYKPVNELPPDIVPKPDLPWWYYVLRALKPIDDAIDLFTTPPLLPGVNNGDDGCSNSDNKNNNDNNEWPPGYI